MQKQTGTGARRVAAIVVLAAASLTLSGCAAAARVLTVVDAMSSLHDILTSAALSGAVDPPASDAMAVRAVVAGTGGAGLRLESRPGSGRLSVWPDGSHVTVACAATGRGVSGPHGTTSTWSRVTTADGERGFMSDAYLQTTEHAESIPPC